MEKEEITTLMVDDDYAPVITEEEACELKPILNGFVEAYVQNSKKAIKEWKKKKIKESLPEASDEQVDEIIDDIEVSIKANEDAKNALIEAKMQALLLKIIDTVEKKHFNSEITSNEVAQSNSAE